MNFTRRRGVETEIDAQAGADEGTALAPPGATLSAIAREDARILADLARAVEDDLARPDLAASTERAYAHDWADFATFCRRHGLEALPAAPQTLALYLKSLETKKSQSPAGLRNGTPGCPSQRYGGASPRSRANTRPRSSRRRRIIRWSRNSCDATAARAGRRRRRRTRSLSSGFQQF